MRELFPLLRRPTIAMCSFSILWLFILSATVVPKGVIKKYVPDSDFKSLALKLWSEGKVSEPLFYSAKLFTEAMDVEIHGRGAFQRRRR